MPNNFDDLVNDGTAVTAGGANANLSEEERIKRETYTEEEIRDVNNITVTIPDPDTPIVVLFGAPSSGKTMALLRMIRFFDKKSYSVEPVAVFRPKSDKHYEKMCAGLKTMAYSKYSPGATDIISFMLVKILNQGRPVCQILEAPGEHYFDGTGNSAFPTYIETIVGTVNRKTWIFFVQKDWGEDANERELYKQAIHRIRLGAQDEVVFLFNQSDRFGHLFIGGHPDKEAFAREINQQYTNIFQPYQNTGVKKVLYGRDNFKMVCFSSGTFKPTLDHKEVWIPGDDDWYCNELWNALNLPNK